MVREALQQAHVLAAELLQPTQELFSDVCGAPADPQVGQHHSAAQFQQNALSQLQKLDLLVADLVQTGNLPIVRSLHSANQSTHTGVLIEDISAEFTASMGDEASMGELTDKTWLVAALYTVDSVLLTPWTNHQLALAARGIIQKLCAAANGHSIPLDAPQQQPLSDQVLLVSCMPAILTQLQTYLMKEADQHEKVVLPRQQEPDTFARCLAGRQLAFLIRQLDYQQLGSILPLALPCVSATVKDQSPAVQCYGLQALQHVATEALSADLRPHQRQLMTTAQDILVGCDDTVWPVAAPTACAILCAVGTGCQGPGYQEVVKELLRQAETQGHKHARRLVWLEAVKPVFAVLGLLTLRFFSTLMPLLLEWCSEPDHTTQLKALEALQEVIRHTWPRMPAHASFMWSQLQTICSENRLNIDAALDAPGNGMSKCRDADVVSKQIEQCLAGIAEMLFMCGGPAFQTSVQDMLISSDNVHKDVMLHAVASHTPPPS